MYRYGENISYDCNLLERSDIEQLKVFDCGNEVVNLYIRNELVRNNEIQNIDGLHYKFFDLDTQEIIAVVALASSGIIHTMTNYTHILPAIKIDILAVDMKYQKLHYNKESEMSNIPDEHYYFSDEIMGNIIKFCREISNEKVLADYIVLYADRNALRYYERNCFEDFSKFMVGEQNQEINENIPMYMDIRN